MARFHELTAGEIQSSDAESLRVAYSALLAHHMAETTALIAERDEYKGAAVAFGLRPAVHALHGGAAVCMFTLDPPALWPEGHRWCRITDRHELTCEACAVVLVAAGPLADRWAEDR